jgi:hypothetical protein
MKGEDLGYRDDVRFHRDLAGMGRHKKCFREGHGAELRIAETVVPPAEVHSDGQKV